MRNLALSLVLAGSGLINAGAQEVDRIDSREQAENQMAEWRAARRALAIPAALSTPHWAIRGGARAEIVLISTVADAVVFDLEAFSPDGERFPLGRHAVTPTNHLHLDLRELLRPYGEATPEEGSLRLSFTGDDRTLSGWLIQDEGGRQLEIPLVSSLASVGTQWQSYYDLGNHRQLQPSYYFANHGAVPVSYQISLGLEGRVLTSAVGIISPGESVSLRSMVGGERLPRRAWLQFDHDGEHHVITASGFLEGPEHLTSLPITPAEHKPAKTHHVVRVPMGGNRSTVVTLWAPEEASTVAIRLLSSPDGHEIVTRTAVLQAGEVRMIQLDSLLRRGIGQPEARLLIEGSAPVHVSGFSENADGSAVDLAFFGGSYGHSTGSYPVLDVEEHEVFTTLVNIGEELASVVVELYWQGGAYSYGPFPLRSGESRRVSVDDLIRDQTPDLLGRRVPPSIAAGLLRWATVGAGDLIARTEVRKRGSNDSFGFNCKSCCEQLPYGAIVPDLVEFLPGQSVPFQSAYYYSACDGTMGPYPITPESKVVPAPFSWNGTTVTASSAADADIEFEAQVQGRSFMCFAIFRWILGKGRAALCKRVHLDPFSATQACTLQTSTCLLCNACCWSQYNYKVCIGKDPFLRDSERNTCLGLCAAEKCN
ncbi:MAG TPA: hypothetical protein VHM02_02985 [Thermoanaerobaculia bacterium]|nr:hypothetical protein [Thermoanaerobaculia bacterium]